LYNLAAGISVTLAVSRHMSPLHPLRIATAVTEGLAGYLQIGWLLFGVYELLRRRPVRIRASRQLLALLAILGIVTAFAFIQPSWPSAYRYFARVGFRSLLSAIGFSVAGRAFWQTRRRRGG